MTNNEDEELNNRIKDIIESVPICSIGYRLGYYNVQDVESIVEVMKDAKRAGIELERAYDLCAYIMSEIAHNQDTEILDVLFSEFGSSNERLGQLTEKEVLLMAYFYGRWCEEKRWWYELDRFQKSMGRK